MINKIHNEDCFVTMERMFKQGIFPNVILTSPFYNTNKKAGTSKTLNKKNEKYVRYDCHIDNLSENEYREFMIELFECFDCILAKNGVILFNMSYGSENTTSMWLVIADIIQHTAFTLADHIVWKKKTAIPNNMSPNKLTRITENIFVICRKEEFTSFQCSKKVASVRKSGQKVYENIYNFVEAVNNDVPCPLNKATFSTELCQKLLNIYSKENDLIYDCFMGTGTTAKAVILMGGRKFIGSEISAKQCEYAEKRIGGLNAN